MDFVVSLSTTMGCYDSILFVVDRLNMSAHFIPVLVKYTVKRLPDLYRIEIV